MRYPSVQTLRQLVPKEPEKAPGIRKILEGRSALRKSSLTMLDKLVVVDEFIGNFGVEWLAYECQREVQIAPLGFYYSNAGDTYNVTLILIQETFRVSDWGTLVEQHERRCAACRKLSAYGAS